MVLLRFEAELYDEALKPSLEAVISSGGWGFSLTDAVTISCHVTLLTCVEIEPSIKVLDAS